MAGSGRNGWAAASLAVGVVAFLTAWIPFLGLVVASAALALGVLGLKQARRAEGRGRRKALAGVVLGAAAGAAGLLLVAGSLFMGDVFNADNLLTGKCSYSAGFSCEEARYEDGAVEMRVTNKRGAPVTVTDIKYGTGGEEKKRCGPGTTVTAEDGETMTLRCETEKDGEELELYEMEVTYTTRGEEEKATGTVMV